MTCRSIEQPSVQNPDAQLLAAGIDTSVIPEDTDNFAPRVGLAWTPGTDGRTIVRAGYGIFYGRTPAIMIGTAHSNNGINVQTLTFTGASLPVYPNIHASVPVGASIPKPTIFAFDPGYREPAGSSGQLRHRARHHIGHQPSGSRISTCKATTCSARSTRTSAPSTTVTTPISTGGTATYRRYTDRPLANFARVILFQSSADSRYNGWTVDLNKRFAHNWQARLAYTYSKVEDNKPDATAVVPGGSDDAKYIQDPLDIDGDWAPGDNDVRHRVVLSGVWDLDAYTSSSSGWQKWLLGGWSLSGIAAYQSGQPYSPVVLSDLNNDGNSRNDRAPGFARNSFRLPSQISVDPRIAKTLPLPGAVRVQLIAEAFNVFDNSNVNSERNTFYALTGGQLVPQTNPATGFGSAALSAGPRIVQLAARVTF